MQKYVTVAFMRERKIGRRTVILREDLRNWLRRNPPRAPEVTVANGNETSSARVTSALSVPPLPLEFLWPPYIAIGKITVVLDATSSTTSALTSYVTAMASAGATFPFCHNSRQATKTIVMASKRAIRNSIRPQLDVFGADLTKVEFLHDIDGKLGTRNFASAKQARAKTH